MYSGTLQPGGRGLSRCHPPPVCLRHLSRSSYRRPSYSSLYVNGCTLFYLVSNPADIPRTFSRIVFPEGSSFQLLPGTIFLRSCFQRPHSSHNRPAYPAGSFIVRWAVTVPGLGDECGYFGPPISAHLFSAVMNIPYYGASPCVLCESVRIPTSDWEQPTVLERFSISPTKISLVRGTILYTGRCGFSGPNPHDTPFLQDVTKSALWSPGCWSLYVQGKARPLRTLDYQLRHRGISRPCELLWRSHPPKIGISTW